VGVSHTRINTRIRRGVSSAHSSAANTYPLFCDSCRTVDIPRKLPFHLLSFVDYKYRQRLRLVASFAVSCFRVPHSFLSSSLFVVVDVDFQTDTFLEASRSCVLEGFVYFLSFIFSLHVFAEESDSWILLVIQVSYF